MTSAAPVAGQPPAPAAEVFGARLPLAGRYAEWLAEDGVRRGLIGPREVGRIWERHLLNCAVVTDLVPHGARVVDVGSGAGLPGLPMAVRRPDLQLDLVEPMRRRTDFLTEVLADLGLAAQVRVLRGRAEAPEIADLAGKADWVVARAVAPLDRLVRWCLPLLTADGTLLALKGRTAEAEVAAAHEMLAELGVGAADVLVVGEPLLTEPTIVVAVRRLRSSGGGIAG